MRVPRPSCSAEGREGGRKGGREVLLCASVRRIELAFGVVAFARHHHVFEFEEGRPPRFRDDVGHAQQRVLVPRRLLPQHRRDLVERGRVAEAAARVVVDYLGAQSRRRLDRRKGRRFVWWRRAQPRPLVRARRIRCGLSLGETAHGLSAKLGTASSPVRFLASLLYRHLGSVARRLPGSTIHLPSHDHHAAVPAESML
jgi:hypothetical protein